MRFEIIRFVSLNEGCRTHEEPTPPSPVKPTTSGLHHRDDQADRMIKSVTGGVVPVSGMTNRRELSGLRPLATKVVRA